MRLLYVDESESNNRVTMVGISISESSWRQFFDRLLAFRKQIAIQFGIKLRDEWHARDIWRNSGIVFDRKLGFDHAKRRQFFRTVALFARNSPEIEIFVTSLPRPNSLERAWSRLIQRFENDLSRRSERGVVVADGGHDYTYRKVSRKMMAFNPIPSRIHQGQSLNSPVLSIIEDPFFRDSHDSYLIQLVDVICWLCRVRHDATNTQRHWGINEIYKALKPVLKLQASKHDPYGFVLK